MVPSNFTVETLIVFHEFLFLFFRVGLPVTAGYICCIDFNGVNIHGVSFLGSGASSSSTVIVVAISFDSKCLIEPGTCIWAIGAKFLPFPMLFLSFFYPMFKGPSDLQVIMISADDSIKESSFESKFELFYDSMFSKGEVAKACKLFELGDVLIKTFSLFEAS